MITYYYYYWRMSVYFTKIYYWLYILPGFIFFSHLKPHTNTFDVQSYSFIASIQRTTGLDFCDTHVLCVLGLLCYVLCVLGLLCCVLCVLGPWTFVLRALRAWILYFECLDFCDVCFACLHFCAAYLHVCAACFARLKFCATFVIWVVGLLFYMFFHWIFWGLGG